MQKVTHFITSKTDLKFLWGQLVGITPTTFWPWGNCPHRPHAVGAYAWTYYSAEANTQKGRRMHQTAHFKINNVKKFRGGKGDTPFGVGFVIKRSLIRLPARSTQPSIPPR